MSEPTQLTDLRAHELLAGYTRGDFSPLEVTRAVLDLIERVQPLVNAFVRVDAEAALGMAAASAQRWRRGEPQGLLDGVPVSVKDLLLQAGGPTLRGSRTLSPQRTWDEDAPCVTRLRAQGAVLLGKTTTSEFGWKPVTDSPLTGVTRNPYDLTRTSGGSSGGSGAAVALGACPLSVGTDAGGSIRIPASFCGVLGLKPTYGRVPIHPHSPYGALAHLGPMARDAADAALLLDAISGEDWRDGTHLGPVPPLSGCLHRGVQGLRIAYSPSLGGKAAVDPTVASAVRTAVEHLADLGAQVEETDPGLPDVEDAFRTLWSGFSARATRHLNDERRALLDPGLRETAARGAGLSALDHLEAEEARYDLGHRMGHFHTTYDLLVTPTMPLTAFEAGTDVPRRTEHADWLGWTPFTYPFNLTQQPAATLPCGLDDEGLPIGLQLIGARHHDALVLRAAHALGTALGPLPRPQPSS
ncbi:amidase [Streptomyces aureocirculatus]|uniref:amidase n=1 Tax=Streptomyces aureocirculatus TaxID=67275 RepID=UPI0004CC6186|nr:amidase [Streptomyces aureocirculatus]